MFKRLIKAFKTTRLEIYSVNMQFLFTEADAFAVGAALGPLFAGLISPSGWNNVFYMLISADILACLVRHYIITLY